jgi:outer membrane immunogenic protein
MSRLSIVVAAAVSTLAFTQIAAAANYNWTGFYAGLNAGYAWGRSQATSSSDCPAILGYYCVGGISLANSAAVSADASGSLTPKGFTGGGQLGYNWQRGNVVFGVEADFNALDLNASFAAGRVYPSMAGIRYTTGVSVNTDWLITLRGRLGWAMQNDLLLYGTGGLAITKIEVRTNFADNNAAGGVSGAFGESSNSETKLGWTVGAGLEWAFARNWTLKGEYLYVDFGSVNTNAVIVYAPLLPANTNSLSTSADLTAHIARLGINYKF